MFMGINLNVINITTYIIKIFFIIICTYFTFLRIVNERKIHMKLIAKIFICIIIITIITVFIRYKSNSVISTIYLIFSIGLICLPEINNNVGYSILISMIALSINYIIFFGATIISFIINMMITIENDKINMALIIFIHIIILYSIFKIKKLKNGISFLNKNLHNEYFDMIILNIATVILFSFLIFPYINFNIARNLTIGFIIFSIIMIITIQKSFQLYYKHKLLVKELEETKAELANEKEHVTALEQENLEISEKNHSFAHKQRSLEHKIDKLMLKTETAEEIDVKNKLDNISKELYTKAATVELTKTGVEEVDDMLDCMQADCEKYNIDFNLQVTGNIYYMTNNLVSRDELSTLIADHVKDAIIAINYSDNINKSILARLGEIEDCYGLYIYDSGIEFEKETLENLGKKPYTTHKEDGGTGMGFMNTFKTLRKHKASLIINEIGKPSKDNFTKVIKIKFDGKNEYKVISYKENLEVNV